MLETTGTQEKLFIDFPRLITQPLQSLLLLQSLFNTDSLDQKYEAYKYTLKNHNFLCITTNNDGLYELFVKNGYITFYDYKGNLFKNVDLSGVDVQTLLVKFCKTLEKAAYCLVSIKVGIIGKEEYREFEYILSVEDGKITRQSIYVERHS